MAEASTIPAVGFCITRLNGSKYAIWSQKITLLLKHHGLWEVVSEPPEDLSPSNNERALSLIGLTLEDQQLVHIQDLDSAKEWWDAVKQIYVRESIGAQIHLMQKLLRARLHTGGDMLAHLQLMKRTLIELQEKGQTFPEVQQAFILLCSLDATYDQFVSSPEVLPQTELTLNRITSRLLDEDR